MGVSVVLVSSTPIPQRSAPATELRRWIPAASMMLVSLISYIDRNTLALLAPTLLEETHLSGKEYGLIISSFSLAYTIGNPIWGRVLDRTGLRFGMLAAVALWSTASTAHAFVSGFFGFAVARAVLGFGEGATFPGGMRVVAQTLPPERRARGLALAYSGGSLGALVTPLIVTPIAVAHGVRAAFLWTGAVGLAWLVLWSFVGGRDDLVRPAVEEASLATEAPRLRDRRTAAFIAAYAMGALPLALVLYVAPVYLHRALGLSQAALGRLLWIPPLGWELGYFFWGWVSERASAGPRERSFRVLFRFLAAASAPLALTSLLKSAALVMAALFASMFIAAGFIIVALSYATHVHGTRHAAYVAGLGAGSWSAIVMVVMPIFGHLLDTRAFGATFALAAAFPIAGYAVWYACAKDARLS
jgi:ACS family hexuronate transporter-like MFS transporter